MKKVLKTIHSASCEFQNASILLSAAINLVNSTKHELLILRSDTAFTKMHEKAIICANKNQINIEDDVRNNRSRRSQCYNRKLDEFYESTIGKTALKLTDPQNVKKDILYEIIDR